MQGSTLKKIVRNGFWLSLLLHLLLLISFSVTLLYPAKEELVATNNQPKHDYVPSYVYSGATSAPKPSPQIAKAETENNPQPTFKSESKEKNQSSDPKAISLGSILASTNRVLQQNQQQAVKAALSKEEPMYMIGDDSHPADPLIKLLGRSLSTNFAYPKVPGELGIKGRVIIALTLNPAGNYTDVQMIRSSENPELDAAALKAVNTAPDVKGADRFLSKPKHFVIGFLFR